MLQEAKDLQNRAVTSLYNMAHGRDLSITFRAPTGSGKTRMMADFMNRLLTEQNDIIFIVSTLSKGNLAQQNYDSFMDGVRAGDFPKLKPYLINTEITTEEQLYIPTDYNVYVLPRDLFKAGGVLTRGPLDNFLRTMTDGDFSTGFGKKIYLIKDECHQATNNLDGIADRYFSRIFNFSATPKMKRGQQPDVQITDEEAVAARLIKRVEFNDDPSVTVDDAIEKFLEIKAQYSRLLGVTPCLIIQISNKDKAEEEWAERIKPALDHHQALKWMMIVNTYKQSGETDKNKEVLCDTNDDVKKKLPVAKWKDYAKGSHSTIDVIIFKMVISEGWDIPRACMLYQVRDTQSKQLDEQVMGRVRRNPHLLDFENLSPEAQELATTAWVWGVKPTSLTKTMQVSLWKMGDVNLQEQIRVKTTKLIQPTERRDFSIQSFMSQQTSPTTHKDIFTLYMKLKRGDNALQDLCYEYAGDSYLNWWHFMEHYDKVKQNYDTYVCDYSQSMIEGEETSFPVNSTYIETINHCEIEDWVWCRKDSGNPQFAFDSDAEREWANFLSTIAQSGAAMVEQLGDEEDRFLWGKNFPFNSGINYEYYSNGIHRSFPDFILKDRSGGIHIFEVKSVNGNSAAGFDAEEYEAKIDELKKCYMASSAKLKKHFFYIPIKDGDNWQVFRYVDGRETIMSKQQVKGLFR